MSSIVRPIKFVNVGHVDSGKSTLAGHLLYKTGAVEERTMEELRRRADANKMKGWEFSYLLDIYEEEQKKGKTIDYNLVSFSYKDQEYILVDCPGHQIYVRNLIAGLNATRPAETIGCLVISLAEGEYEAGMGGGQTREDVLLLRAVGITELVVLMNKVDLVPEGSERYSKIQQEVDTHVKKLGFKMVKFHPISGYRGQGLLELLDLLKTMNQSLPVPPPQSELFTRTEIKIQARLMYDETYSLLFSTGLSLILHCGTGEYQIIVEKLQDAKETKRVPFALNGATVTATVSSSTPFHARVGDRIILRRDDHTVGFGVVRG